MSKFLINNKQGDFYREQALFLPDSKVRNFTSAFQSKTDFFRALKDQEIEYLINERFFNPQWIQDLGVHYYRRGFWSWFAFPIVDADWNHVYTKLKKHPSGSDNQPKALTLPKGNNSLLYPLPLLRSASADIDKPIFLCEGEPDTVALLSRGFTAVTSTHGVKTFPASFLEDFPYKCRVICAFDRDDAGRDGTDRLAVLFHQLRPDIRFQKFVFPDDMPGKDITDYFSYKRAKDQGTSIDPSFNKNSGILPPVGTELVLPSESENDD